MLRATAIAIAVVGCKFNLVGWTQEHLDPRVLTALLLLRAGYDYAR